MSELFENFGISLATSIVDHFLTNPLINKIRAKVDKQGLKKHISKVIEAEATKLQNEHPYIDIEGLKESILDDKALALIAAALDINGSDHQAFYESAYRKAHATSKAMQHSVNCFVQKLAEAIRDYYRNRITPEDRVLIHDAFNGIENEMDWRFPKTPTIKARIPYITAPAVPENCIPRYIHSIHDSQMGNGCPILEALQNDKHIVLLDSAGSGKTIATLECYHIAKSKGYNPIWVPLRFYVGIGNDDCNEESYAVKYLLNNAQSDHIFILDGFDELRSDLVTEFIQLLNSKSETLANIMIVVTSRWNFYNIYGNGNGQLASFKPYELSRITEESINNYISSRGIVVADFRSAVKNAQLLDLIAIPFYLENICKIYKQNASLPIRTHVMDDIIDNRYSEDLYKFADRDQLSEKMNQLNKQLMKLAISMQFMQSYSISNEDYHTIISENDDWQLLKCAGIWQQEANGYWSFAHNNLREYLAAKYLNILGEVDEIVNKVSDKNPETGHYNLKPSWINVVSYLLQIYPDGVLCNWILENAPGDMILFDSNRLTEAQCEKALWHIFAYCNENHYYLEWNQQEKCAALVKSARSVELIRQEIRTSVSAFGKQNAIRVLWHLPVLRWEKEPVKTVLLEVVYYASSTELKRESLKALAKHHLCSNDDAAVIIPLFEGCQDQNILDALLCLLQSVQCPSEFIDYYISLLPLVHQGNIINVSFRLEIEKALLCADTFESLTKVLSALIGSEIIYLTRKEHGIFAKLCDKCAELYSTDPQIKQYLFDYIINPQIRYYHSVWADVGIFSLRIGAASELLSLSFNTGNTYILARAMNKELMDIFIESLHSGVFTINQGHEMLDFLDWNTEEYQALNDTLFSLTGEHYESHSKQLQEERIQKEKAERQRFFDALFDIDLYNALVQEILFSDVKEFSITGLLEADIDYYDARYLCFCYFDSYIKDLDYDKIVNWKSHVDFQWFALNKIVQMLEEKPESQPILTENQRERIEQFVRHYLSQNRIEAHCEGSSVSIDAHLHIVLHAVSRLNIPCTNMQYRQMMRIPRILLDGKSTPDTLSPYIYEHLSKDEIKEEYLLMLSSGELADLLRPMFFAFCIEEKLLTNDVRDFAVRTIQTVEYSHEAIRYLNDLFGKEYLLQEVVLKCQSIEKALYVLNCIEFIDSSNQLDEYLWNGFRQTNNNNVLVKLISRNHLPSIQLLLSESKRLGHIPKVANSTDVVFSEYTEALSQINDPNLLPYLFEFFRLSIDNNFTDDEFGLCYSARRAILNILDLTKDYDGVLELIEKDVHTANNEYQKILYPLRQEIRKQQLVQSEAPLSCRKASKQAQAWISEL